MKEVLVLGASGCAGHKVCQEALKAGFDVYGTCRPDSYDKTKSFLKDARIWITRDYKAILNAVALCKADYIINCLGFIKHRGENPVQAIQINSLFPHELATFTKGMSKLIHISTDCVFNGIDGHYNHEVLRSGSGSKEPAYYMCSSTPNAEDLYGRTKLLGELWGHEHALTIRTSIVGPELFHKTGLLEWYLANRNAASISGYINHYFSGVSTLHLSKVICEIIQNDAVGKTLQDVEQYASEPISKYELLLMMQRHFGGSVDICPTRVKPCHRSLFNTFGCELPKWEQMCKEMALDWKENYADL